MDRIPASWNEKKADAVINQILENALAGEQNILATNFMARQLNIYWRAENEVQRFEKNLTALAAKAAHNANFTANPLAHDSYGKLLMYWEVSHDVLDRVSFIYEKLLKMRIDPKEDLSRRLAANLVLTDLHQWLEQRSEADKLQMIELIETLEQIKKANSLTVDIADPNQKRQFASVDGYDFASFQFLHDPRVLNTKFQKNKAEIKKLAQASTSVPNPFLDGREVPKIQFDETRKPSSNNPAIPDPGPDGNFFGLGVTTGTFMFTFDDGPKQAPTERLLNYLKTYSDKVNPKMPATFFVLLQNVNKFPDTVRTIQKMGYGVHDHSFDHQDLNAASHSTRVMEVTDTIPALKKFLGHDFEFFRCPYGSCVAPKVPEVRQMIANAGLIHAHWAIDSLDWKNIGQPERTYNIIMEQMKIVRRGTILMHDIHESSVDAAIKVLGNIKQQNDSGTAKIRLISLEQAVKEYNAACAAAAPRK